MAMLGLRYDLRAPSWGSATHAEMYAACLDQARWGDERGIDFVVLSEHHGAEDGYIPAPVTMAAAIAGRTRRIGINIAAVLVPLHDPVRLAEELAVLDLASGGRVSFVAGVGYRYEEFEMASIDRKQRGKLLEEYVDVMLKAWTGGPFEWRGRAGPGAPQPRTPPHHLPRSGARLRARRLAHPGPAPPEGRGPPRLRPGEPRAVRAQGAPAASRRRCLNGRSVGTGPLPDELRTPHTARLAPSTPGYDAILAAHE